MREQVETRIYTAGRWRCSEDVRISRTRIRRERAVQTDTCHLNSVLRMRRAEHDRGRASEENSVTAAEHGLVVERITETKTWTKVISIANGRGRVKAYSSKRRARIVHRRVSQVLQVVTQA